MGPPAATPVTMPVLATMLACPELLLLQVPPVAESVSVILFPVHTVAGPLIIDGIGVMVTLITVETVTLPLETLTVNTSLPL